MHLLLFLILLFCRIVGAHAASLVAADAPGPHGVGLRIVAQYDQARGYRGPTDPVTGLPVAGERARPVQTWVWYPARKGGTALAMIDYLRPVASEADFGRAQADVERITADLLKRYGAELGPQRGGILLQERMLAVRDAAPAPGRFPVVIYAPSFNASANENLGLCEYLAGHGYIVLASPSLGAHGRNMTTDLDGLRAQAADIGFLIGYARTLPQADPGPVGVIGFSWGGLSNALAAARDSRIGALVSLDGSLRYYPELAAASKEITPAAMTAPMLYVAARPETIESLNRRGKSTASSPLNDMKYADVRVLSMLPMKHANFSSMALRFAPEAAFQDYSRDEVVQAYGWTALYVRRFLDAYLKRDAAALAFLRNAPAANGMPAHMAWLDAHDGQGQAPSQAALARELAQHGFDHAAEAYQTMRRGAPGFQLAETQLNDWGYVLLREHADAAAAVAIFKLAAELYPDSGNAFDSLAEGYDSMGDQAQAVASYRRSLQLDPHNDNAARRLRALGGAP